ncbi:MAG: YfdX family protein [Xanthomonadales bacterium]|nr:YfdX family protein [Xanthomonadales bacterium]
MIKKHTLTTTVSTLLAAGMVAAGAASVMAAEKTAKGAEESTQAQQDLVRVSEDAMLGMQDMNRARMALFNGQPGMARTQIDAAVTRINAAVEEAETYAVDVDQENQDDWYIPFDTQLAVTDAWVPENTKSDMQEKTSKHAGKDEMKKLDTDFTLSEVDMAMSAGMVPVKFAQEHIIKASKLISEGQFYDANLALKAVDDAVIVQTYAIDDTMEDDSATDSTS